MWYGPHVAVVTERNRGTVRGVLQFSISKLHRCNKVCWSWLPLAVGGAGMVLMGVRLFAGGAVGLANNGDGPRVLCRIGGAIDGPPARAAEFFSFARFFVPRLPQGSECAPYRSTQVLQLQITAWVHQHVLGLPGAIDMREVMAEDCVLVGIALGVLTALLARAATWARLVVALAAFLVLADATFADYAASPYSEPAAFIGLVCVALAGVAVMAGRRRRTALLLVTLGAVLAVGAKAQTITLAVPIAAFLIFQSVAWGRLRGRIGARVAPMVCVVPVVLTAHWANGLNSYETINVGNLVTMTLMPQSPDPAQVAEQLGLPRSFAQYSGTHWWSPHPIYADPLYSQYQHLFTRAHLTHYFKQHPGSAWRVVQGGADDYLTFRPDYLGTYSAYSGKEPLSKECRICVLPTVSRIFSWSGIYGIAGYWLSCLVAAGLLIRRSTPGSTRRGFAWVANVLLGAAIMQYLAATFGDGVEVTKHLVIGLFAAALTPVWLLASLFSSPDRHTHDRHPPQTTAAALPGLPVSNAEDVTLITVQST